MRPKIKGRGGFTLLEVMIAVSISAGVLIITLAAVRAGVSTWKKGEEAGLRSSVKVALAQRLAKELASVYPYEKRGEGGIEFNGGANEIGFVTSAPGMTGLPWGGFRHLRYFLKQGQLTSAESTVPGPIGKGLESVIADDVEGLEFSYLGDTGWEQAWDADVRKSLPRQIRIEVRFAGQEKPFVITANPGVASSDEAVTGGGA